MSLLPTSRYHNIREPNLHAVVRKISEAVQRGLPNAQEQSKYRKVGVLMMHWSNDNLGVAPLESELAKVFSEVYNFAVESYVIQADPPPGPPLGGLFNRRLWEFVDRYQGPQSLMIYVYSGYADGRPAPCAKECIWYGTDAIPMPFLNCSQVNWWQHRIITDGAFGDTLYILNCCYDATTSAICQTDNEYLVAAATENPVGGGTVRETFMRRLIDLLVANNGDPQTVASLHASMISNMKAADANTNMQHTPIHIGGASKPTIILQRLPRTPGDLQTVNHFDTTGAGKVVISVSLQGQASLPDIQKFENWLSSYIPHNVVSAKVEAAFQAAGSSTILFTVPNEVWSYLEGNGAFRSVAYVDSHNLLLPAGQLQDLEGEEDSREQGFQVCDVPQRSLPISPSSAGT
ncbi:MAG: hypothetical protein Q9208_005310 [Pyrenodesmia sp. 3 TL-2023]